VTINGETKIAAVLGYPVRHSLSPQMHNEAFARLGLNFAYIPCQVAPGQLEAAIAGIRGLGFAGANVTIPHKVAVAGLVDELSEEARLTGAVNTVVNTDGHLKGYNTDGMGFVRSMSEELGYTPAGLRCCLIGAGGAARALAVQLAMDGAGPIDICNRTWEKAVELAGFLREELGVSARGLPLEEGELSAALKRADLVIHATSRGMYPHEHDPPLIDVGMLNAQAIVCDIVYRPLRTRLLQEAEAAGHDILTGLGMLVYQGAIGFELWTGCPAPVEVMKEVLVTELCHTC